MPVGNATTKFTGTLDGTGHAISGLTVNRASTNYVGLFGYASGATLRNVGLQNGSTIGRNNTGGAAANLTLKKGLDLTASGHGTIDLNFQAGASSPADSTNGLDYAFSSDTHPPRCRLARPKMQAGIRRRPPPATSLPKKENGWPRGAARPCARRRNRASPFRGNRNS